MPNRSRRETGLAMLYGDLTMRTSPSFIAQLARGATAGLAGAALVFCAGCAQGEAKDVVVLWHLVDRRSCMDTAVAQVTVDVVGGATATGGCHANALDNQLPVKGVRAGDTLSARAQSAQEAIIYRGELKLADPVPAVIELPLYYTGGD
jgi:hypothetical protein